MNGTGKVMALIGDLVLIFAVVSMFILFFVLPNAGVEMKYILTASMTPTLQVGDAVGVAKIDITEITKGDIIAFRLKDVVVIHRVADVQGFLEDPVILTRGDALNHIDPWQIKRGDLVGKIIFRIPLIGYSAKIFKDKVGLFLGMIFLILLASLVIVDILKEDRKKPVKRRRRRGNNISLISFAIGAVIILTFWVIMSRGIIAQNENLSDMVQSGGETRYSMEKFIENKGIIPLLFVIRSDAEVEIQSFWLMPGEKRTVRFLSINKVLDLEMGAFFPFMPKNIVETIFLFNPKMAAFSAAFVLIIPLVAVIVITSRKKRKIIKRKGDISW